MICFRKQEERKNWSGNFILLLLFFFRTGEQRTDAVEFWRLVGDNGKWIREDKEKKRTWDSVGTVGWVFEMEKVRICCYMFGF